MSLNLNSFDINELNKNGSPSQLNNNDRSTGETSNNEGGVTDASLILNGLPTNDNNKITISIPNTNPHKKQMLSHNYSNNQAGANPV